MATPTISTAASVDHAKRDHLLLGVATGCPPVTAARVDEIARPDVENTEGGLFKLPC
jgi:hypothetical protein